MDYSENEVIVYNVEDTVVGYNNLNHASRLPVQTKSGFTESKLEAWEKEMQIISPMGGLS